MNRSSVMSKLKIPGTCVGTALSIFRTDAGKMAETRVLQKAQDESWVMSLNARQATNLAASCLR
jgi:hypothetical protein